MTTTESTPDIIGMEEALKMLKTTRPTFYRWLREGRIRGKKVGRQWRFTRRDLQDFIDGKDPRDELGVPVDPVIEELTVRAAELGLDVDSLAPAGDTGSPVADLLNLVMKVGIGSRATDIHIGTLAGTSGSGLQACVRLRLDGVIHTLLEFDSRIGQALIDRVKLLSNCDVRIRHLPQDARLLLDHLGREIDIRVATIPEVHGESVTLRILDVQNVSLDLGDAGFSEEVLGRLHAALARPSGVTVVTGPTGCGKTTTLYCALNELAGPEVKINTIEDPVEFVLPWVNQLQVNHREGLTIPRALRAILRQAPNAIMVTEMRDAETVRLCLSAGLTGHQVFTCMHAEDGPAALKRLVELTGDPALVGDAVNLIVSQRLVRRLCPHCSQAARPDPGTVAELKELARANGIDAGDVSGATRRPEGCPKCRQTGFLGRTLIAEALVPESSLIDALRIEDSSPDIRSMAMKRGMLPLVGDGLRKVLDGETTLEEIRRVTNLS